MLNRRSATLTLLFFFLFLIITALSPTAAARADSGDIRISVNGQLLAPDVLPTLQEGHLLVPMRLLAEALGANVTWNDSNGTALVSTRETGIALKVNNREVVKNGQTLTIEAPAQIKQGRLLVPLRFLAESLGAEVAWNQNIPAVAITNPPIPIPERIHKEAFPAQVAFSNNNNLWLLDGNQADAEPLQITTQGSVEIIGWSPDGQWLAYLQHGTPELWASDPYLWVVKADGSSAVQVEPRPILGQPSWSPLANTLLYSTMAPGENYQPDMNLKLAALESGKVLTTTLLPDNSDSVQDYAWAPDGQSLAISLRRDENHPLRIDRLTLSGERSNLLTLGEAGITFDEIYASFALGLSWSPNGRYLAYYLHPNSGSLAADGVDLQVLDLEQPDNPLDLGMSLKYKQWLAWSPDGTELAFIQGGNREAIFNKRLCSVSLPTGKITFYDSPGKVDTQPLWLPAPENGLLFCRGLERGPELWGRVNLNKTLVSDQRIWLAESDGQIRPLTAGTPDKADCYPSSPDGQELYFLRLESALSGSLYQQPPDGGEPVELLRNVNGDIGYYGNYLPAWISIYYPETVKPAQINGRLEVSNIEGRHFELETSQGRFVLLPEKNTPTLATELEQYIGQQVTVEGFVVDEDNIYMRGPIIRVRSIIPIDKTPNGIKP